MYIYKKVEIDIFFQIFWFWSGGGGGGGGGSTLRNSEAELKNGLSYIKKNVYTTLRRNKTRREVKCTEF